MFDTDCASFPAPGAELAAVVDRALDAVTQHADVELRRLLVASEQLTSWAQSSSSAVIAEIARRDLIRQQELHEAILASGEESTGGLGFRHRMFADDSHRFLADEVATELAVSRGSAQHKVEFALTLEQYPRVAAAMRCGRLDRPKADSIAELLGSVESDAFRDTLEQAAVEYGAGHTRPQLRAWLGKRILPEERRWPSVGARKPGTNGECACMNWVMVWPPLLPTYPPRPHSPSTARSTSWRTHRVPKSTSVSDQWHR